MEVANTLALLALAVAAVLVVSSPAGEVSGFGGAYIVDSFARAMKILNIFGTAVTLVLSHHFMKVEGMACFEYPVLVLLASRRHADDDLGQRPHMLFTWDSNCNR